jgi:hypothetical protein
MRWMNAVFARNAAIVVLLIAGGILSSCGGEGRGEAGYGYQPEGAFEVIPRAQGPDNTAFG